MPQVRVEGRSPPVPEAVPPLRGVGVGRPLRFAEDELKRADPREEFGWEADAAR